MTSIHFPDTFQNPPLFFRPARESDWKDLLELRNDPLVVENSLSPNLIKEEDHREWLRFVLEDQGRRIWIVEMPSKDPYLPHFVGQIRADFFVFENNPYLELSWSLVTNFRGQGMGFKILGTLVEQDFEPTFNFLARIKSNNGASIRLAEKCGFQFLKSTPDIEYWVRKTPN